MLVQELSFDPKAAEEIVLSLAADVTGAWLTSNESIVEELQDFHVLGHDFLEKYISLNPLGSSAQIGQSASLSICFLCGHGLHSEMTGGLLESGYSCANRVQ